MPVIKFLVPRNRELPFTEEELLPGKQTIQHAGTVLGVEITADEGVIFDHEIFGNKDVVHFFESRQDDKKGQEKVGTGILKSGKEYPKMLQPGDKIVVVWFGNYDEAVPKRDLFLIKRRVERY